MDVDQRSMINWKTLNCLLRENFSYAFDSDSDSTKDLRKVQQQFDMFIDIVDTVMLKGKLGVRFMLSGSMREGVTISPVLRDNILETDIMFSFKCLKIKAHEQSKALLDVPFAPGHVKVTVPDPSEISKYESLDSCSLDVRCALKEVSTPEGQIRYFLLAHPDDEHPRALFDIGPDGFEFSKMKEMKSPAMEAMWDFFFGPHGFHEPTAKRSGPAFARSTGFTKEGFIRMNRGKENLAASVPTILTNEIGRQLNRIYKKEKKSKSNVSEEDGVPAFFTDIILPFTNATDTDRSEQETKQTKKERPCSTKDRRNENLMKGMSNLFSQALDIFGKSSENNEKVKRGADAIFGGLLGKPFPFSDTSSDTSGDSSHRCLPSIEQQDEDKTTDALETIDSTGAHKKKVLDKDTIKETTLERCTGTCPKAPRDRKVKNLETDPLFPRVFDKGGSIDFVPSLECEGWPTIASSFLTRQRLWPSKHVIEQMVNDGFHIVPKCSLGGDRELEWRISFSQAEITLFENMTDFQVLHIVQERDCYRMFKSIYYSEMQRPKVLCSYFMKTIFLWTCERLPVHSWEEENLAWLLMSLLDNLLHCLVTKTCEHYFIPENNLFQHIPEEFLLHHARTVSKIRTHPDRYPSKAVQEKLKHADRSKDFPKNIDDHVVVDDDDDKEERDDDNDDSIINDDSNALRISGIELD